MLDIKNSYLFLCIFISKCERLNLGRKDTVTTYKRQLRTSSSKICKDSQMLTRRNCWKLFVFIKINPSSEAVWWTLYKLHLSTVHTGTAMNNWIQLMLLLWKHIDADSAPQRLIHFSQDAAINQLIHQTCCLKVILHYNGERSNCLLQFKMLKQLQTS